MGNKTSTWVGGAVVVALLIAVAGWFFAISPTIDEASTATIDAQAAEDRNDQLAAQLVTLKEQATHLEEYKLDLAGLQAQIPTTDGIPEFLRRIDTQAQAAGTTVTVVTVAAPANVQPAVPAAPAAATPAPADGATPEPTPSPAADAAAEAVAAAPTGPAVIPGFVAIQVDITAVGTVANTFALLNSLQAESGRQFLVTGLKATGQKEAEPADGRPATAEGDVELVITGFIYVLQDLAPVAPADGAPAVPLPTPAGGGLPFNGGA
jgi:hypothetical protein